MSSEVADDARALAATAVAARRRLRPEPQVDVDGADYEVEALYASADDGGDDRPGNGSGVRASAPIDDEIGAADTAVLAAVASGAAARGGRRSNGAGPDADDLVTAHNRGATAENTAVLPDTPATGETVVALPADPPRTAETTVALPADPPRTAETTVALPADPPRSAETTGFLPDGARPAPARRRDGIVVPLRVPLRLRLRAATGLVVMVVVLGVITATVVLALALMAAQLLSNF
jgi:hypothetical protein